MKKTALSLAATSLMVTGMLAPAASAVTTTTETTASATTTATTQSYETSVLYYTVKQGDSLSSIAKRYNVSGGYLRLAQMNGISSPYIIKVGQELKVPMAVYVVQPGEGWYAISRNTGVPVSTLYSLNPEAATQTLHPYQIISLPA